MFIKTAIALAIIVGTASASLAAPKPSSATKRDVYDCRGGSFGLDRKALINRPQKGMCDFVEE
jgi:hypothetical protein